MNLSNIKRRLARIALQQGKFKEAQEHLKSILTNETNLISVSCSKGIRDTLLTAESVFSYLIFFKLAPSVPLTAIYKELVAILLCCKDYEEALKICNQLLQVDNFDIMTLLLTSDALKMIKNYDEALQHCRNSLNLLKTLQEKELEKREISSNSLTLECNQTTVYMNSRNFSLNFIRRLKVLF